MRRFIISILCVALSSAAVSAPQKRPVRRVATVVPQMTASQYAARVQGLNSCEQFAEQFAQFPSAAPMLIALPYSREMIISDGIKKGEFESTDVFEARKAAFWVRSLGDASRIVVDAKIPPHQLTYNADAGVMQVKYVVNGGGRGQVSTIQFGEKLSDTGGYTAHNSYGAQVDVTALRNVKELLEFSQDQIVGDGGSRGWPEWQIPMSTDEARAFKADPHIKVWIALRSPFYVNDVEHLKATYDDPTDVWVHNHKWVGDVKCAIFTSGSNLVKKITVQ
jgi:hypothetical protein